MYLAHVKLWTNHLLCVAAVLLSIAAVACTTPNVNRQVGPCPPPPPPPECNPQTFEGTVFDTSRFYGRVHWHIRRVDGASDEPQEFAIYKAGNTSVLLSGSSKAETRYLVIELPTDDRVLRARSQNSQSFLLTSVDDDAIMGDASLQSFSVEKGETSLKPSASKLGSVNLPLYWDGHPTVSPDGKTMVFASDRPESIGGTDLYVSVKTPDGWSSPLPVNGPVNTPCDELSPRFAGDTTLVFASAGHSTVGGYDLFASTITWSSSGLVLGEPRNLGTPVNTPYDELFPYWADNNTMYYSSDQPRYDGGGRKDFDVFVLTTTVRADAPPPPPPPRTIDKTTITGTVIHHETHEPVADADVTARAVDNNSVVAKTKTDAGGVYTLDVPVDTPIDVSAQSPDLFFDDIRMIIPADKANDTVAVERPLSLPISFILRVNFPTAIFDDPYTNTLDSNGVETTQTWQEALDLLAKNVEFSGSRLKRLVLIGHTDDVDTRESNLTLGNNRVGFVMSELEKRGVPRDIMEGRSAGETLLPDKRDNELLDTWRKRARRVELVKVLRK